MVAYSVISGCIYEGYTLHGVFFDSANASRMFGSILSSMIEAETAINPDCDKTIEVDKWSLTDKHYRIGNREVIIKSWDSENEIPYNDVYGDTSPWDDLDK